jgi:S1-C subfamily serine protease
MNSSTLNLKPFLYVVCGVAIGGLAIFALRKNAAADPTLNYQPNLRPASFEAPAGTISGLKELDAMFTELAAFTSEAVVHIQVRPDRQQTFSGAMGGDGSGLIISADGWIVTNDHVVRNSDEVNVILADGRELKGKVTTVDDEMLDIALVKIDAKNLPVLKFADSDSVRPGQMVLAVGSPFGLENTVTFGHVSAIGRIGQASDGYQAPRVYSGMIQTDASINPGNSGGPLVNVDGLVVGVNTSIYSTSGSSSGIGFAIPSNVVQAVAKEVMATGKFDRGLMGVVPRDLKPYEAKEMKTLGAFVVNAESGAAKSGIKAGDVITQIDGRKIANEVDLRVVLYEKSPNDKVEVVYVRDGQQHNAQVTLSAPQQVVRNEQPQIERRPQSPFDGQPDMRDLFPQERPTLGVFLYEVDDTTRDQYGLPGGLQGALIYRVRSGSLAERAGLQIGDVIVGLNDTKITSPEAVVNFISRVKAGDELVVKFVRMQEEKAVEKTVRIRLQ